MSKTILLAAGGTGGHVFPAIALAEVLLARGHHVELVTDKRGERFFSGLNLVPEVVASSAMPKDFKGRLMAGWKIASGIVHSLELCREHGPDVVVGFGGYPSFPTLFAAQLLKIPTVLHEQNAVFGRANRQVAEKAKMIATSFPETRNINIHHQSKIVYVGNPIRKAFHAISNAYQAPEKDAPFHILIFGGSQGSSLFSQVIPAAIELLDPELRKNLVITQQCRKEDIDKVNLTYNRIAVSARIESFFNDMPSLYQRAHLVIGRSGASVAEITAMGRPSILIPFASSLDGDQAENAAQLVKRKAAWLFEEKGFTPESLAAKLTELMTNPATLVAAAQSAKELGNLNAAEKLADAVLQAAA